MSNPLRRKVGWFFLLWGAITNVVVVVFNLIVGLGKPRRNR